jgi:hypothetical protein
MLVGRVLLPLRTLDTTVIFPSFFKLDFVQIRRRDLPPSYEELGPSRKKNALVASIQAVFDRQNVNLSDPLPYQGHDHRGHHRHFDLLDLRDHRALRGAMIGTLHMRQHPNCSIQKPLQKHSLGNHGPLSLRESHIKTLDRRRIVDLLKSMKELEVMLVGFFLASTDDRG